MTGSPEHVGDICVVTCYFNPSRYRTRRANFDRFAAALVAAGAPLFVAEMAVEGEAFELPDSDTALRVRTRSALWQKERLLNLLVARLPERYTKLAWLDCDLLFEDEGWLQAASQALETHAAVQPFTTAVRLPRGHDRWQGVGEEHMGFAAVVGADPSLVGAGLFRTHGHTGFAWAARRDWVARCGLYDVCLSGSGDHLMAHAFCGDWESGCIRRIFGSAGAYYQHFRAWAERVHAAVGGRIGCLDGRVLHLWHGDYADRKYPVRDHQLMLFGFDPATDLVLNADSCWEPVQTGQLSEWARRCFDERREDGPVSG